MARQEWPLSGPKVVSVWLMIANASPPLIPNFLHLYWICPFFSHFLGEEVFPHFAVITSSRSPLSYHRTPPTAARRNFQGGQWLLVLNIRWYHTKYQSNQRGNLCQRQTLFWQKVDVWSIWLFILGPVAHKLYAHLPSFKQLAVGGSCLGHRDRQGAGQWGQDTHISCFPTLGVFGVRPFWAASPVYCQSTYDQVGFFPTFP